MNPDGKTAQYVFYLVIFLVVIGLLFLSLYFYSRYVPTKIESNSKTYTYTLPVVTKILRQNLPALIDTVWADSTSHEVASYREKVSKGKTSVDFGIRYDERTNLFDVNADITAVVESVFVEKETIKTITRKPKFIGLTGGISIGGSSFTNPQLSQAGIDAGFKFVGKYSATAFINTDKNYGVRLGIDF